MRCLSDRLCGSRLSDEAEVAGRLLREELAQKDSIILLLNGEVQRLSCQNQQLLVRLGDQAKTEQELLLRLQESRNAESASCQLAHLLKKECDQLRLSKMGLEGEAAYLKSRLVSEQSAVAKLKDELIEKQKAKEILEQVDFDSESEDKANRQFLAERGATQAQLERAGCRLLRLAECKGEQLAGVTETITKFVEVFLRMVDMLYGEEERRDTRKQGFQGRLRTGWRFIKELVKARTEE